MDKRQKNNITDELSTSRNKILPGVGGSDENPMQNCACPAVKQPNSLFQNQGYIINNNVVLRKNGRKRKQMEAEISNSRAASAVREEKMT